VCGECLAEDARDLQHQFIASRMSERVGDDLEPIHRNQQHGETTFRAAAQFAHPTVEPAEEVLPVRQAGE